MVMKGNLGDDSVTIERARAGGHEPAINSAPLVADNKVWPTGLILSEDGDGDLLPYGQVSANIADGDAATSDFAIELGQIEPGSVLITDGTETFSDDGFGTLTGDATGSGKVNYLNGSIEVSFNAAPGNGDAIDIDYIPEPVAVLDVEVDTASNTSGLIIRHGSVNKDLLKVGVDAPTAPGASLLRKLLNRGVFAV